MSRNHLGLRAIGDHRQKVLMWEIIYTLFRTFVYPGLNLCFKGMNAQKSWQGQDFKLWVLMCSTSLVSSMKYLLSLPSSAHFKILKVSLSESSLKLRMSFCPRFTVFMMWIGMGNLSGCLCDLHVSLCLSALTVVSQERSGLSLLYFCLARKEACAKRRDESFLFIFFFSNGFGSPGFM